MHLLKLICLKMLYPYGVSYRTQKFIEDLMSVTLPAVKVVNIVPYCSNVLPGFPGLYFGSVCPGVSAVNIVNYDGHVFSLSLLSHDLLIRSTETNAWFVGWKLHCENLSVLEVPDEDAPNVLEEDSASQEPYIRMKQFYYSVDFQHAQIFAEIVNDNNYEIWLQSQNRNLNWAGALENIPSGLQVLELRNSSGTVLYTLALNLDSDYRPFELVSFVDNTVTLKLFEDASLILYFNDGSWSFEGETVSFNSCIEGQLNHTFIPGGTITQIGVGVVSPYTSQIIWIINV